MESKNLHKLKAIKCKIGKWRILLLVFLTVYITFLLTNLTSLTVQWDESSHLIGGVMLLHGRLDSYMSMAFYPPLYDLVTAGFFALAGPSLFVGRLVSVTFAVLTVVAVFEFTYRVYEPRTAFVAAVLLGTMPGLIWLAKVAMLDVLMVFFYSATLMLFYLWIQKNDNKYLFLTGLMLGLGFLSKYPVVITVVAMFAGILFFGGTQIKKGLTRFPYLLLTSALIALPWLIALYQTYSSNMFSEWLNVMNLQIPQSLNVPAPVYYLIAMVWPYGAVHPISFLIYGLGLAGLGFLVWRHKTQDKFLLVWFITTYIAFTFIGQVQWRYILPAFPALAMSAAVFINSAYSKAENTWKQAGVSLKRKRFAKISAVCLVGLTVFGVAYSYVDTYNWAQADAGFNLPLAPTAQYVAERLGSNESLVVLCPINEFSDNTVKFYIYDANQGQEVNVWQYPDAAMDTYPATFDTTELISLCEENNAKYAILFEYGETYPYYNSDLSSSVIYSMINATERFTLEETFGSYPQKIFVFSFS